MFQKYFVIFYFLLTVRLQFILCVYDNRVITTLKHVPLRVKLTVVNGQPATLRQMPYLVSIKDYTAILKKWKNFCGGSIISKHHVLTAAHCFEFDYFYYGRHPELLQVVAGCLYNDLDMAAPLRSPTQWRDIKDIVLHEHFNFPDNDIALITVDKPWDFTDYVNKIPIARMSIDYDSACIVAGFGRVNHSIKLSKSPVLIVARINLMPRGRCSELWEMNMNDHICTSSKVSDVSKGDSGGPLACVDTGDPSEAKGDVLVGVVSGKNFDTTTIFTRVSEYHDWVRKHERLRLNSKAISPTAHVPIILLYNTLFILIYL